MPWSHIRGLGQERGQYSQLGGSCDATPSVRSMVPTQGTDHQVHACSFCSILCKICLDALILLCGKKAWACVSVWRSACKVSVHSCMGTKARESALKSPHYTCQFSVLSEVGSLLRTCSPMHYHSMLMFLPVHVLALRIARCCWLHSKCLIHAKGLSW
jgi:hypothetical protein